MKVVLRIQLLEPNNSTGVKVTLYRQLYLLVHRIDGFFPRHRPLFESNILTYNSVWPPRQAFISGMRRRSRGRKFETKYSHWIPCRLPPNSDSYYFCFTFFSCSAGDRVICWKLDKKEYFFALVKPAGQNMSNGSRQAFLFRDGQLLPKIFSKKGWWASYMSLDESKSFFDTHHNLHFTVSLNYSTKQIESKT